MGESLLVATAFSLMALVMCACVLVLGFAAWWWARAMSAVANAMLQHKQVAAFEPQAPDETAPVTSDADAERVAPVLNTRTRLRDLSDDELAAAARGAHPDDGRVITFNDNEQIDETRPVGDRMGVYAQ